MPKLVVWGTLGALLLGCGSTSRELTLGDSLVVDVDEGPSGAGRVQVSVGAHPCHRTKLAFAWSGGDAHTFVVRSSEVAC